MPLTNRLTLSFAAFCLIASAFSSTRAQAQTQIPDYFFSEWTVTKDCTEQHAGIGGHLPVGLKIRVARASADEYAETYGLEIKRHKDDRWRPAWKNFRLEYRAGTRLKNLPADFVCIPGEEASSPFLAMSGYSIAAEPWYEYEHWYGAAMIHGKLHHVLIFPRAEGKEGPVIVLHDAESEDGISLDHDGVIHSQNGA